VCADGWVCCVSWLHWGLADVVCLSVHTVVVCVVVVDDVVRRDLVCTRRVVLLLVVSVGGCSGIVCIHGLLVGDCGFCFHVSINVGVVGVVVVVVVAVVGRGGIVLLLGF